MTTWHPHGEEHSRPVQVVTRQWIAETAGVAWGFVEQLSAASFPPFAAVGDAGNLILHAQGDNVEIDSRLIGYAESLPGGPTATKRRRFYVFGPPGKAASVEAGRVVRRWVAGQAGKAGT